MKNSHHKRPRPIAAVSTIAPIRVVLLWRSYLPYSFDRLRAVITHEPELGVRTFGLEVTTSDPTYDFIATERVADDRLSTCFPDRRFVSLTSREIRHAVARELDALNPDVVFSPATPFAEGMAAIAWALRHRRRVFVMDDAWEQTDFRGVAVTGVKRLIHACIDGVVVPHALYTSYWQRLGMSADRVIPGLDVLDNQRFARPPAQYGRGSGFLFVGRDVSRKGLATLLEAYQAYRIRTGGVPWPLRVVGPMLPPPSGLPPGVTFGGALSGDALLAAYFDAAVLVVPSHFEQWGLVVNEGMAAGLPVIATGSVGASRVLIDEGVTGWIVPPRDSASLATRLGAVASLPPSDLQRIAQRAERKVVDECGVSRFATAIQRAISLPPRPAPPALSRAAALLWPGYARPTI
jgi:glycosyltransferase involved in cell wall biosynthesis